MMMKKFFALLLSLLLLPCIPAFAADSYTVFYVATTGSDTNNGSFDAPFATLNKAVSAAAGKQNAVIKLREGRYSMTSVIYLNARHRNLTVTAYPGEQVTLTGAQDSPFSAFEPVTDSAVLDRIIEQTGKEKVVSTDLTKLGITSYSSPKYAGFGIWDTCFPSLLTAGDTPLILAEYPNRGYVYSDRVLTDGSTGDGYQGRRINPCTITVKSDRWKQWKQAENIWALSFLRHDWADANTPVSSITEEGVMTTYVTPNYPAKSNRRIRFFNLLEELDAPGEYYVDPDTKIMYLIPPEGMTPQDTITYTAYSNLFFRISSTSGITLRNLKLEGTTSLGIYAEKSSGITVEGCELKSIGDTAVRFSQCTDSGVKNSYLHNLSSRGIYFQDCGNRKTLTNSGCFVTGTRVQTFSQYQRTYVPAVQADGCGFTITHNEFSDAPHSAIIYNGNNCFIEYNEFFNVCNDTSDSGGIYTGRNWTTRGNVIRYNYFHDMKSIQTTTKMAMQAVYLDDLHSSTTVFGNVFYKVSTPALIGGGRENVFSNNLMLECSKHLVADSRGTSWYDLSPSASMWKRLDDMPYQTGIWAETYPKLVNIKEDQPELPKYNQLQNNVCYKTQEMNLANNVKKYGDVKDNITVYSASAFRDYKNLDFTVEETSEIRTKLPGFQPIPFDQIGLEKTEEEPDEAPYATDLTLQGTGIENQPLTLSYTYCGRGFEEGDTAITWYVYRNGAYWPVPGNHTNTYTPSPSERGLAVRAAVTPVNREGTAGKTVRSGTVTVTRPYGDEILSAAKTGSQLFIQNRDSQPQSVLIVQTNYRMMEKWKVMTDLHTKREQIPAGGSITVTVDPTLILRVFCADNLEPISVTE